MNPLQLPQAGGYAAPTREESTEAALRTNLKSLDPLLDIMWHPMGFWNERQRRWEGRYALTVDWPHADQRWSMVQSGEVNPKDAHDIVGWLCADMQDPKSLPTSPDGIEQRVLALLGTMDNLRYPWKERFEAMVQTNIRHRRNIKKESLDIFEAEAEYLYRKLYHVPQVTGGLTKENTSAKSNPAS